MNVRRATPLLNHRAKRDTTILNYQFSIFHSYREERQQMFLNIVKADGTAEQAVIREMKARAAGARGDIEQIVRGVMADVQQRGWDAVVEYAERFDGKAPYIVEPKVLDDAYNACDPKLIAALEKAAANIRDYHEQMLVKTWEWNRSGGETLGQTVRGLSRVGIYVPGGTAAYPSSVLMNAIPAKVAGVGELIMVTPPTENMSNEVLAAAKIAGVDTVIAIGGTQAIAALTYGAGFIPQVDKIVGPGNAFVAAAKKLAFGTVDIDMIAGPSEVLVIADHTANPTYVAADLLSQAEHDKLASAVLLTDSMAQAQAISCEMERQAKLLPRWDIIKESVANYGCAIVFDSVMTLQNAIDLRRLGFSRWWLILLLAGVTGAFGVLLFFEPFAALAMVRFIGAVLVLDGCADLVSVLCLTYWVKKAKRGLEAIYDEARYEAAAIEAEGRIQDESEP